MPHYFPGKKVFGVAAIAAVLLVVTIFTRNDDALPQPSIADSLLNTVAFAGSSFVDTDEDGLPDWEEELLGVDPNNPDINNNGVLDGDEFNVRKSLAGLVESDSLIGALRAIQNDPNAGDPTANLTITPPVYEKPFGDRDVLHVESSKPNREQYLKEATLLLVSHLEILELKPLEAIDRYVQEFNEDDLLTLQTVSNKSKALANKLMALQVPVDLSTIHLDLANNVYLSGRSLEDISFTEDDPTLGFFASANYANHQTKYRKAVAELTQYYHNHE